MKKDSLFTGLILGGMLGVTVALLATNKKNMEKAESGQNNIQLKKSKESDSTKQESSSKNKQKNDKNTQQDETGSNKGKTNQNTSDEVKEKENIAEEEKRNPAEEVEKKAKKEGTGMGEEVISKLSFSKKITQLEEALKKLREESS